MTRFAKLAACQMAGNPRSSLTSQRLDEHELSIEQNSPPPTFFSRRKMKRQSSASWGSGQVEMPH